MFTEAALTPSGGVIEITGSLGWLRQTSLLGVAED
jgi:hypothetical protein